MSHRTETTVRVVDYRAATCKLSVRFDNDRVVGGSIVLGQDLPIEIGRATFLDLAGLFVEASREMENS